MVVVTTESTRLEKTGRSIVDTARTETTLDVLGPRRQKGEVPGEWLETLKHWVGVCLSSFQTIDAACVISQALPTTALENVTSFHR